MPSVLDPVSRNIYVTVKPELASERLSDLGYEWILALLKEHGAILFRGFNLDLQQFEEIGNRFCSSFVTNSSPDRLKISTDGRIQSVYVGIAGLPMHAEISREPWKPDVLFFGCEKPLWFGGETMICDGICVAENLQPETQGFTCPA